MMGISIEQYNKMAERLTELEYELAESVKVVRCKDCIHWASAEDYDCEIHSGAFGAEDFCSYGERKGGDTE